VAAAWLSSFLVALAAAVLHAIELNFCFWVAASLENCCKVIKR
jgi:hypothetical protein